MVTAMAAEAEKEIEPIPSVKDLASSEPALRRKNLQQILTHLENRSPTQRLTHTQALQLWRGFHVALYMHDSKNQLSVQTLIATLANTFEVIRRKDVEIASTPTAPKSEEVTSTKSEGIVSGDAANKGIGEDEFAGFEDDASSVQSSQSDESWLATFSTAFWETMAREWSGVDQWRMNKFLLLIRFALREIFKICLSSYLGIEEAATGHENHRQLEEEQDKQAPNTKKRKGTGSDKNGSKKNRTSKPASASTQASPNQDKTTSKSQLSILSTWPLSPRDRKVSDGLRLHMLDIYLDELFNAVNGIKSQIDSEPQFNSKSTAEVLKEEFMAPIRLVASEGLAKHVRTKAKEVLAEFDERIVDL